MTYKVAGKTFENLDLADRYAASLSGNKRSGRKRVAIIDERGRKVGEWFGGRNVGFLKSQQNPEYDPSEDEEI